MEDNDRISKQNERMKRLNSFNGYLFGLETLLRFEYEDLINKGKTIEESYKLLVERYGDINYSQYILCKIFDKWIDRDKGVEDIERAMYFNSSWYPNANKV